MPNGIGKLYKNDFIKGLATAVFSSIIVVIYQLTIVSGFDVFNTDWVSLFQNVLNTSIITLFGYLMKNLLSTDKGSVLNITPEDKPVI